MKSSALLGATLLAVSLAGCAAAGPSPSPATLLPVGPSQSPAAPTASPPNNDPPPASQTPVGVWRSAAPLNVGRVGFDTVVLGDGSVLVVGDDHACIPGGAEAGSERAELYEPGNDRWVEVESLNKPRKIPATVRLADGSAMVIGGINSDDVSFSSTKLFSPATRSWTDGPLLDIARGGPIAATLDDGRVLVASFVAVTDGSGNTTTEIFDPSVGAWSRGPSLSSVFLEDLLLLADGRLLGIGFDRTDTEPGLVAVLYDPSRNAWVAIDAPGTGLGFDLVALADGGALAIGGWDGGELYGGDGSMTARVDRLDPTSGRWRPAAPLSIARAETASVRLADGLVLVAGGLAGDGFEGPAVSVVEVYDPAADLWLVMPELLEPRYGANAVVLGDGDVILMGGYADFNVYGDTPWCGTPMTSVERFTPSSP